MPSITVGQTIAKKRKERNVSLNKLEEVTKMDRASIRRMERGESAVPSVVDNKMAKLFYDDAKCQNAFVNQCKLERKKGRDQIKARRRRRREMTEAKKRYGARVCYAFKSNIDKKSRTIKEGDEYTYKGINLYVYITSKKEPDKVKISISLEDLVFNEDSSGKQYYDGKAINPYLKYCTENRIGKYALLDMAKGEVEKTNLFYPLLQKKCPYIYGKPVVASKDEIKEILSFFNEVIAIRDNEDIEFAKEWAKSLAMDTKAWLERSNEFCEEKREKLINKVDEVCKLVESKLSNV